MIKLDKENFKIETDCKTVGEFMTQAAAIGFDRLEINVDGCRYEFFDSPKIRVTDDTPLDFVLLDGIGSGGPGSDTVYIKVLTKPKPKTVKKSGWINIYDYDGVRTISRCIFETESGAKFALSNAGYTKVATVRVEWEEVTE